jgi:small-conductance mechanosensitive channel/tryptophan-rich sensory protein
MLKLQAALTALLILAGLAAPATQAAPTAQTAAVPAAANATASPPAATTATAPNTSAAPAPAKKPHTPTMLSRVFAQIELAGTNIARDFRSLTDLPALSAWLDARFSDAAERDAFNQGGLWIALIFAITIGVDVLLLWVLRRRSAPTPDDVAPAADSSRLRYTLRRLAVRFGPIFGATLAGNAALAFVAEWPVARTVAFGIVNTYVAVRLMLALLDEFVRAEAATPAVASPLLATRARQLPGGLRWLLIGIVIVVALQLLSGDITEELGAPDSIQEALAKCIALVAHVLAILIVLVSRRTVSGWIQQRSRPGTYWAAVTEALAAIWPTVAICAIAGSWLVWALDIPDAYREIVRVMVATVAVLLLSRFIGNLLVGGFNRRIGGYASAPVGSFGARLFAYRNGARLILQMLLVVATLIALTEAWGLPSLAWFGDGHPGHRFAALALQLLILAIIGIVCWEAADLAFERRVSSLTDATSRSRATRLRTLQPIIRFALLVLIGLVVVMTALNAIGINVGPLLAGAGIFGVALGFGSQKLVQDFITGIFLLVEDAMDVGDWVTLAGVSGTVEHISIRSIRLRGGDGSVYLIPFSSVTSVNNTNRGLGNAAVSVNIDPSEDTDRVSALLVDIAQEMRKEPAFAAGMQSDLQLWGVDKVDGSMITISGQIVCTDAGRWGVQREFNRRMKLCFDREGIKLATPKQTLSIVAIPSAGANDDRDKLKNHPPAN